MTTQRKSIPAKVTLIPKTSPKGRDSFKVSTPVLTIHPGDMVEFKFEGCTNPVIMVPVENVFVENRVTDKNHKGIIRLDVRPDAPVTGKPFPYMVYSPDTDEFAEGNSPPRMILKK